MSILMNHVQLAGSEEDRAPALGGPLQIRQKLLHSNDRPKIRFDPYTYRVSVADPVKAGRQNDADFR